MAPQIKSAPSLAVGKINPKPVNLPGLPSKQPVAPVSVGKPLLKVNKAVGAIKATDQITSLPTKPEPAIEDMGSCTWSIHGERKIGKSLTASRFPGSLSLLFEPGGKGYTGFKQRILAWEQFTQVIDLLENSDNFPTVIIDTADICYDRVFSWGCEQKQVSHPGEVKDFGATWGFIEDEFINQLTRLTNTGRGIVYISHTVKRDFVSRTGGTVNKLIPSMSSQAFSFITGNVDTTLYAGYYGEDRFLTVQGSEDLEAGTRLKNHFWVKGKVGSERIHSIPMGMDEEEAFSNLIRAFNNQQPNRCEPEGWTVLDRTPAKRPKVGGG